MIFKSKKDSSQSPLLERVLKKLLNNKKVGGLTVSNVFFRKSDEN